MNDGTGLRTLANRIQKAKNELKKLSDTDPKAIRLRSRIAADEREVAAIKADYTVEVQPEEAVPAG